MRPRLRSSADPDERVALQQTVARCLEPAGIAGMTVMPGASARLTGELLLGELDRGLHRRELAKALLVLGRGVGVGDDAGARLEVGDPVTHDRRPEGDARVHGAVRERVQDGAAVRPAPEALELGDQLHGSDLRSPAHRAGGEARAEDVEGRHAVADLADHLRDEVRDVREPLDLHAARDVHRPGTAHAREVVAPEVDEHHVLGPVLLRREQPLDVSLGRLGRARDRAEARAPVLARDQPLGRRADERDPGELEEEEIRRRVDAAKRPVDVERRCRGRALGPLGRDALEHVAGDDVPLDRADHLLVARRARGSAGAGRRCRGSRGARGCRRRAVPRPRRGRRRAPPPCRPRGRTGRASPRRRRGSPGTRDRPRGARRSARAPATWS